MASAIFTKAYNGTLTAADLVGHKSQIDDVDVKTKLTPLGAAVWKGYFKQVKLLLDNGANVNGVAGSRLPLWVAAAKTSTDPGRMVDLLLKRKADARLPSLIDGNSTPLLGAVRTGKPPALISKLVGAHADPDAPDQNGVTARKIAEDRNDRDTLQALLPLRERVKARIPVLLQLSGLMLFVVAWANNNVKIATAAGGAGVGALVSAFAIKKRFSFSGLFDPLIPSRFKALKPKDQFKKDINSYIKASKLDRFFPPGNKFLETVVERAVELDADPSNTLDVHDLTRVALYQPFLYCDDSGSMKTDSRREHQNQLVQRITSIATRIVPDDEGIELRFINAATTSAMRKPSTDTINRIMADLPLDGWTEIGTNLRKKVLEDAVYTPLKNGTFKRPVLVSIITDGHPQGPHGTAETVDSLKKAIEECGRTLALPEYGYDPKVVRFQVSQIGPDEEAAKFLDTLDEDPSLRDVLYRTAGRLDDRFQDLRDNDTRLEQWLLQLLMGPITDADSS